MRRTLAVTVTGLFVFVGVATTQTLQPLKAQTGQWQITAMVSWSGLPPQMAAMMTAAVPTTYKSCVAAKDLSTNPWSNGSGNKCPWKVLNSTGSDMEVQATSCNLGNNAGMKMDIHGTIHLQDSEHGTAMMTMTLTSNGQTANGTASYTGAWIGATCSAQ